jgi:LuxR family maltose regulon positive regulatory protein
MPKRGSPLAKLSRPRLHNAIDRTRIFRHMDEARAQCSAICVLGPPGAGKTTLVASWIEARRLKGIWFQVDPGDADPAMFLYYMGQAAIPWTRKGQHRLALLTPEYLGDVPGFSRRFFRELFLRLPDGATLVLDNYQDIARDSALHQLLANAIPDIPRGMTLLAISRVDLPECYSRHIANRDLAILHPDDLTLTVDEARELSARQGHFSPENISALNARVGGWAAGLVLMLERLRRGAPSDDPDGPEQLQDVFNYFAAEVLQQVSDESRRLLIALSYLPALTAAQAVALTDSSGAGFLLEQLHRRNLFVDRRTAHSETVYQLHALFRAYLRFEAGRNLSADEQAALMMCAARILETSGQPAEAFDLYSEAQAWDAAAQIVRNQAASLVARGLWATVVKWIETLPVAMVEADSWLLHWWGATHIAIAPPLARERLERACARAKERGDTMCELQSAAGIVESCCVEWHVFSPMDRWLPVLKHAMDPQIVWPSADAELRALHALASALVYRHPSDPLTALCVERTFEALERASDANLKLVAACTLANHSGHNFKPEVSRRARILMDRLIDDPSVSMPNRGAALFSRSWLRHAFGDVQGARAAVAETERLARQEGLTYILTFAGLMGTCIEGAAGDIEAAARWVAVMEEGINPARWYDRVISASTRAWYGAFSGRCEMTFEHGPRAVELCEDGVVSSQIQWRLPLADAHTQAGNEQEARRWIAEIRTIALDHRLHHYLPVLLAFEATLALRAGDMALADHLIAECFGQCRKYGYELYLRWNRRMLPALCARALAVGIETEKVTQVIRSFKWPPPSTLNNTELEVWPWAVRVRVFGRFELECNGAPVVFSGKAPKKPLALLKAIVCMGGTGIPVQRLTDAIWSDEDGDAAYRAFNTALYRLRELLRCNEAILVADGKVSLDQTLVWIDLLAFEAIVRNTKQDIALAHPGLSLYRGPLLAQDDAPWALLARDRARAEFLRLVARMCSALEQADQYVEALKVYDGALDADPLNEMLHQGKMRCHIGLGQQNQALHAYRSLQNLLSIELGTGPSVETEALARTAQLAIS